MPANRNADDSASLNRTGLVFITASRNPALSASRSSKIPITKRIKARICFHMVIAYYRLVFMRLISSVYCRWLCVVPWFEFFSVQPLCSLCLCGYQECGIQQPQRHREHGCCTEKSSGSAQLASFAPAAVRCAVVGQFDVR